MIKWCSQKFQEEGKSRKLIEGMVIKPYEGMT
jgi:hypothetical protein